MATDQLRHLRVAVPAASEQAWWEDGCVLILGFEVTPRFDTPWRALLNGIGVALWLIAVVWVVARHRRGHRTSAWEWVGLVISISIAGVYIPLGPLCVLA